MIGLGILCFGIGLCVGCLWGQWSIYRYYKRKVGRDFYPDVCRLSRGENPNDK